MDAACKESFAGLDETPETCQRKYLVLDCLACSFFLYLSFMQTLSNRVATVITEALQEMGAVAPSCARNVQ